jgi:hypothetical protein
LALSFGFEPWNEASVELDVLRLSETGDAEIRVRVRHASQREHLAHHDSSWLARSTDTLAVFRRNVDPWQSRHVAASQYAKHTRGKTNEERRNNARSQEGAGQYLAERGDVIEGWEREALVAAWLGEDGVRLSRHGEGRTFFVFAGRAHAVGYAGGTGHEVRLLRVEWSSGDVHSHPRGDDH